MNINQWNLKYSEISSSYNALYRKVATKYGFSEAQFSILYHIYIYELTPTQNQLADNFSLSKQTVNSAIAKLTEMGIVQLTKGTVARNSKVVSLTEKGMKLCKKQLQPLIDAENRALGKLSDEQTKQFLYLFELQYHHFADEIQELLQEEE